MLIFVFTAMMSHPNFSLDTFIVKRNFYVSSGGNNANDGGESNPWKSINHTLWNVPKTGGTEVIVKDGEYKDSFDGIFYKGPKFESNILVRAQTPYHVQWVNPKEHWVLYLSNVTNVIFHGFEIYGTEPNQAEPGHKNNYLVQVEDCKNIVLENCIVHDSFSHDILKVNDHSINTVIRGCMFYNQPSGAGGAHLIEVDVASNTTIEDCIFFNNYEASGRVNPSLGASSYIIIRSNTEQLYSSDNQMIRRNVFLNWVGATDESFIVLGGDGKWNPNNHTEVSHTIIENNLFIPGAKSEMSGLFTIKGNVEDLLIHSNTASGWIEHASYGYVIRVHREGFSLGSNNVRIFNNIFSDPSGHMRFLYSGNVGTHLTNGNLTHNLYFNDNVELTANPSSDAFGSDSDPVQLNPGLQADFSLVRTPYFNRANYTFFTGTESGFVSIEHARKELVTLFAIPLQVTEGDSILNMGKGNLLPHDDILGNTRTNGRGSIGAYEKYEIFVAPEDDSEYEKETEKAQKNFKTGLIVVIIVVVVVVVLAVVIILVVFLYLRSRRNKKREEAS